MSNFVIVSSNKKNIKEYKYIIDKKLFKYQEYYKFYEFEKDDDNFEKFLKLRQHVNGYIIDNTSNINIYEIIDKIRKKYKDIMSYIIVIDRENLLNEEEWVSKHYFGAHLLTNNETLIEDIAEIIGLIYYNHTTRNDNLIINYNNMMYKIPFDDILYIEKEAKRKICLVVCKDEIIKTNLSLTEILNKLNNNFIKTHRSAIINKCNVKRFDVCTNDIIFDESRRTNLVSRDKKEEIKEIFTKQV